MPRPSLGMPPRQEPRLWCGDPAYRASFKLAVARQSGWQRITRHLDHAADDCRWQALRSGLIVAGRH